MPNVSFSLPESSLYNKRISNITFIILLFLIPAVITGQGSATISGRVTDQVADKPLPYATVTLNAKAENTLITGTITREDGIFILNNISSGEYKINVSYIGYKDFTTEILIGSLNFNYDIGKVELSPAAEELAEVRIVGERDIISQGMEKKTFNIDENIAQSGGSVLKAIQNLPGITVDPDGIVYLRGSDKVTILMDGKQSSLTGYGNQKGLDNIPAANIETIEIINNPSAKYDARGLAGIINIIYKKEKQTGLSGEFGLAAGAGELNQRRNNLPGIMKKYSFTPKISPDVSINYRTERINLFLQSDGMIRRTVNTNEFSLRDFFEPAANDIQSQFLENRSQQLYNIKAGMDLYLNEKNTLTFYTLWEDEYHIDRGDVPYDYAMTGERYRLWGWAEDEDTKFINFSVSFNHNFIQPGHKIETGYIFTGGGEDELFPFTDSSSVRISRDQTHLFAKEFVHSFNFDYTKPLKSGRIETGTKINLRHLPIEFYLTPGQNTILDLNIGEYSDYYENVVALYLNYIFETAKFDLEAGLRTEQSFIRYEIDPANIYYDKNDKYNYLDFYPNIRATYKLNDDNRLTLFLNKRIDRPGEFELRPFPKYDDPEILKTGNPFLRPQYTNVYELSYKHSWEKGSAYISGFYRQIRDIFSRVYTTDTTSVYNILNTIPANLGKGSNTGLEIFAEQTITSWFKLNGSFNWYSNVINAFSGTHIYPYVQSFSFEETHGKTWNAKINANLRFKNGYEFQMTSIFYARDIIPQGTINSRYSLDIGFNKKLFSDKAEIYLNASDLLNTFGLETTIKGRDFNLLKTNYVETQIIMLGFKYKF